MVAPFVAAHPGLSGVHAMPDAYDAFAARMVLAAAAQRSIDAQYYIWHGDQVGMLLFEALWNAAERGVRVRLLLDDGSTSGHRPDAGRARCASEHRSAPVQPVRAARLAHAGLPERLPRLNRRMHNKSFTADNQATWSAAATSPTNTSAPAGAIGFADLDVLAVGPVVQQVSTQFDLYWNSASAYPAAAFVGAAAADAAARLQAAASRRRVPTRRRSTT